MENCWMTDPLVEPGVGVTAGGQMDHDSGVVTHPKCRMWLRPDGIVQLAWAPRIEIGLQDVTAAIQTMTELTGGRRSPLLVDLHDGATVARPARLEMARRDDLVSAVAMIVGTPLSRVTGNFFLGVNKPPYPTRLFDDEASAVAWLQAFVPSR
jgi:hypothetical protein